MSSALDHGPSDLTRKAVTRAKAGDSEGLHYLYVRYADDVLRYVASFIRDHHEAEDITQNVFAKLITAINKYEEREVPFDAWIMRVARNAALDHLRAKRAVPTEEVRLADTGRAETAQDRCQVVENPPGEISGVRLGGEVESCVLGELADRYTLSRRLRLELAP